ncbi:MAG: SRPBCC family protein [Rhodospirillales bacterium]|nr:SRPBCC family protein [Rhodospirillales bacterium]
MSHATDIGAGSTTRSLTISRTFAAPRRRVFQAWSSAGHMQRWFCPEGLTVPQAEIDFRPGGVCAICMRAPDGEEFWSRGYYIEISPPDRLVFASVVAIGGVERFSARTTVTFENDAGGTRMTVHQDYDIHDEAFGGAVAGASEGWRTTLDKLDREVARIQAAHGHSVTHASFSLERTYNAPPATVFRALADQAAKARWFHGGDTYTVLEHVMDVRPGGHERLQGRWANGMVSTFDAVYCDVVPDTRLVYAYQMSLDARKISVSLATVELHPAGAGTRLVVTEQGAFLDGHDDDGSRERGTGFLLDRLGASLQD